MRVSTWSVAVVARRTDLALDQVPLGVGCREGRFDAVGRVPGCAAGTQHTAHH